MKKFLILILAVMMLLTAREVMADGGALVGFGPDDVISMEVIPASSTASNAVAASSITTNNRILGYTYVDSTAGAMAVHDASAANAENSGTGAFIEDSVVAGDSHTVWFPFPKKVTVGIQAIFENTTGYLVLYYL